MKYISLVTRDCIAVFKTSFSVYSLNIISYSGMNIKILYGKEGALAAKGVVVVVDVFRAATCASVVLAQDTETIFPVRTTKEAFELKKEYPSAILMGEEEGVMVEGFDVGNSPSELERLDLHDTTVIQRTSAGTKGLVLASARLGQEVEKIYFGAFTTISALANLLKKENPTEISIVAMDGEDTEDSYYAQCLQAILKEKKITRQEVKKYLLEHKRSMHFFDESVLSHPEADFYVCTDMDRYDFVVKLTKQDGLIRLQKE